MHQLFQEAHKRERVTWRWGFTETSINYAFIRKVTAESNTLVLCEMTARRHSWWGMWFYILCRTSGQKDNIVRCRSIWQLRCMNICVCVCTLYLNVNSHNVHENSRWNSCLMSSFSETGRKSWRHIGFSCCSTYSEFNLSLLVSFICLWKKINKSEMCSWLLLFHFLTWIEIIYFST